MSGAVMVQMMTVEIGIAVVARNMSAQTDVVVDAALLQVVRRSVPALVLHRVVFVEDIPQVELVPQNLRTAFDSDDGVCAVPQFRGHPASDIGA